MASSSSSASEADTCDPALICSTQMTERENTPMTDLSALFEPNPNETVADWTQWMRWDEFDTEDISSADIRKPSATFLGDNTSIPLPLGVNTIVPKAPFTFQGAAVSPIQTYNNAPNSFSPQTMEIPVFSPKFGFDGQDFPAFVPAPVTNCSTERSPSLTTPHYSPSPVPARQGRKRKSSEDDGAAHASHDSVSPPATKSLPSKKRSHNVIEKRYRANLNEKIAELRDSVPCLRVMYKQRFGGGTGPEDEEEEETIASTNKLNKASILSKATEYIKHLEMRNSRLDEENIALKNRLRQLEKSQDQGLAAFPALINMQSSPGECAASMGSTAGSPPIITDQNPDFLSDGSPNPLYPPEGLIKVPDFFKQFRAATEPQPHYADSFTSRPDVCHEPNSPHHRHGRGGKLANKLMLGTLAGLMITGTLEMRKEESSDRGLMSVPIQALSYGVKYARDHLYMVKASSWHIRALSHFALTSFVVVGCAFLVYLYLFYSRPSRPKSRPQKSRSTTDSASEFRREAWLTSIQTVGVPSHTFFPEWFAVTSRCLEYCLRCLLGWNLYSMLTGISEDDENGRVKAWDIALDAQLTGGDAEVSKSRLVLTIFAAGTLPRSLSRMMLKALHCRTLLWRVGSPGTLACRLADYSARALAQYQWQLAQKMQETLPKDHEDVLPSHLAYLLEYGCDEVFTDAIVQRASNMIWNRPTQEATDGEDSLLDAVVEDSAIRSPLDAIAAWFSSRALQEALTHSLDVTSVDCGPRRRRAFDQHLEVALRSAPPTSAAYTRAATIKALFFDEDRVANINSVLAALPHPKREPSACASIFLDSSVPPSIQEEICISVRCAMIAAILRGQAGNEESESSTLSLNNAIELFNRLPINAVELTFLGFASLYHLLHIVSSDKRLVASSSSSSEKRLPLPNLGRIASGLRYWVENAYNPISSGFNDSLAEKVIRGCVEACENAGVDIDESANSKDQRPSWEDFGDASSSTFSESSGQETENGSSVSNDSSGESELTEPATPSADINETKTSSLGDTGGYLSRLGTKSSPVSNLLLTADFE